MTEAVGDKGGKTRRLHRQGEERVQGKLHCMRQSAKCSERSTKCEVSRLEKMKLVEIFQREVFRLEVER